MVLKKQLIYYGSNFLLLADQQSKNTPFYKSLKAPALLLEIGFIDTNIDNQMFDKKFEWIAECIAKAILDVVSDSIMKKADTSPSFGQRVN